MTQSSEINNTQYTLMRRGYSLGKIDSIDYIRTADPISNWHLGKPVFLSQVCSDQINSNTPNIQQAEALYRAILNKQECDPLLDLTPYKERIEANFEPLGASVNEGDQQEIETLFFDGVNNTNIVAEDLWLKISWLSFYQEDDSIRFRFSFGIDLAEDVAADANRQRYAALLAQAIFPESSVITDNQTLNTLIVQTLQADKFEFVERIVYFNASNGGAYLHHDRERGHAGVVYAQVTGSTFWLALPRQVLVSEIISFVESCHNSHNWPTSVNKKMRSELLNLIASVDDNTQLIAELSSFANDTLIHLINETTEFIQHLISQGHGRLLHAGDALLLPQETDESCCWHTVFNVGGKSGEALSFAIRQN